MIWFFMLLTAFSGYMLIDYIVSKNWICASLTLPTAILSVGSMMIDVEMAAVDAANARFAAKCVDAPAEVLYREGMTLCPGQTAVIHIPAVVVSEPGTEI